MLTSSLRRIPALAAALALIATLLATGASAAIVEPTLKLKAPNGNITLTHYRKQPIYLDLGMWLASEGAPFEFRLTRPDYTQPIIVQQVLKDDSGKEELVTIPNDLVDDWAGFKDFFYVEFRDLEGATVKTLSLPFCPNGFDRQRVSDDGPVTPSYADSCYSNPFTKGMIWGIDRDWAVNPFNYQEVTGVGNGRYTVTVSVDQAFVDLFGMDPGNATKTINLRVKKATDDCYKCYGGRAVEHLSRSQAVPIDNDPDPAILPDLRSLPAWGINITRGRKRTFLTFGATVWVDGASSLVVEGFRREDEDVMDAYQYFYADGEPISRSQVGEMAFDEREGHDHWHFLQFAQYSLLGEDLAAPIISKKEAFCLAPTDPIDLSLANAVWNPGNVGLFTSCGTPNSIWVRETLPLGWGDTYFQGLPGQSFNITNLPNGTYYIAVEANTERLLHEQSTDNNLELREIILGGTPEERTVEVPPWNGIDTETGTGQGGGGGGGVIGH